MIKLLKRLFKRGEPEMTYADFCRTYGNHQQEKIDAFDKMQRENKERFRACEKQEKELWDAHDAKGKEVYEAFFKWLDENYQNRTVYLSIEHLFEWPEIHFPRWVLIEGDYPQYFEPRPPKTKVPVLSELQERFKENYEASYKDITDGQ